MGETAKPSTPTGGVFETSPSLLERAKHRDADAWRRIVLLYGPLVDHWCQQASIPQDDIDDVVQDIFLSVSKQLTQFRYEDAQATFRGWLRVIAKRRVADYFRRTLDRPRATGGTTAVQLLRQSPDPMTVVMTDDADADSEEALISERALELIRTEFKPQQWSAFWRTAIEGAAPTDIADELGMTPAAIRMAKSRVLNRLHHLLKGLVVYPSWGDR